MPAGPSSSGAGGYIHGPGCRSSPNRQRLSESGSSAANHLEITIRTGFQFLRPAEGHGRVRHLRQEVLEALPRQSGEFGVRRPVLQRVREQAGDRIDGIHHRAVPEVVHLLHQEAVDEQLEGDLGPAGIRGTEEFLHHRFGVAVVNVDVFLLHLARLVVHDAGFAAEVTVDAVGIALEVEALEVAPDMECVGIVRRNITCSTINGVKVVTDIRELGKVDVAILATPTRKVEEYAKQCLALGINTVDSFDIHTQIIDLRRSLDAVAKANNAVSIISAGWDPGSDSIVRTLMESLAPRGISYTNFGPGRSMGHSVAVRAIPGVRDALSMTIPVGTGIHRRMVYVELEDGADFKTVEAAIKADAYFVNDETHVMQVPCVDDLNDVGHGVNLVRKGVSGKTHNQLFEFNMKINNPALTSQVLVNMCRAALRQQPGAYTMIEIPVIDMLPGDKEEIIRHLV